MTRLMNDLFRITETFSKAEPKHAPEEAFYKA
jgi:hypothetical protein